MSPPTHRPVVSVHRARSQSQRLPTRKKKCRRKDTKPNLNPYPCPMHPGQWENLKGAGIQLVSRSTMALQCSNLHHSGHQHPGLHRPGHQHPGLNNLGLLPSVALTACPLWTGAGLYEVRMQVSEPQPGRPGPAFSPLPPGTLKEPVSTAWVKEQGRPVLDFCFSFSQTFRFECQGSNVTFYPDSICFLKRHINFQCPQDKESRPIKVRKLRHPECLAIETTTRRVPEHLKNLML